MSRGVCPIAPGIATRQPEFVPLRVLIVDDDEAFRAVARTLLSGSGYAIAGAVATAAEARGSVIGLHAEALLLDVNLPDGNGVTLRRRAARRASRAAHPPDVERHRRRAARRRLPVRREDRARPCGPRGIARQALSEVDETHMRVPAGLARLTQLANHRRRVTVHLRMARRTGGVGRHVAAVKRQRATSSTKLAWDSRKPTREAGPMRFCRRADVRNVGPVVPVGLCLKRVSRGLVLVPAAAARVAGTGGVAGG